MNYRDIVIVRSGSTYKLEQGDGRAFCNLTFSSRLGAANYVRRRKGRHYVHFYYKGSSDSQAITCRV